MRMVLCFGCLLLVTAGGVARGASNGQSGLVVHEWGTFLAMSGSDGVALDGLYHEEHALPAFVHGRSRDGLRLPTSNLKGETPVIYFYSPTPTRVRVDVGFPEGLWTQWYPQADFVGPSLVQLGSPPRPRDGRIRWSVDVVPAGLSAPPLPDTSEDALWNYTRDVDAAYVRAADSTRGNAGEWERFIFYRGLGRAALPVTLDAADGGTLACAGIREPVRHVFVLRVEAGRAAYRYLPSLRCDGERTTQLLPSLDAAAPVGRFETAIGADLTARLVESGLYEKEARAMVNTWRTSYFTTEGTRVLFVLPQSWTDRFIPLTIEPAPASVVRVMVGRIELLTPARERAAATAISNLASPDSDVRARAFATLREQGRYVEPIVRRTLATTTDERVRVLTRRLLLTDFVTELRSSLTHAADGTRLAQEPAYARAHLASLLREIGLTAEARREGELALAALQSMRAPTIADHASRNTYRALARAHEGAGHDRQALAYYSDFVEFGSGYQRCAGCHQLAGPRDHTFFRDWWAGRRFAELAVRTGDAPRLVAESEAALRNDPGDLLARIRLGYLYDVRGDTGAAQRMWAHVEQD